MKKSKLFLSVLLLIYLSLIGCERSRSKNTHKENYNYSSWLGIEGKISKGYQPFLKVTYFAYSDKCKLRKHEGIFTHTFMYIITRFIPVENALYRRPIQNKIYIADINNDGDFYSIKYPNDFEINGCKFEVAETYFNFKKYDKKSQNKNSDYDRTVYGSVFKYFVLDSTSKNLDKIYGLEGNHYCAKTKKSQSNRNFTCHEAGEKYQRDYVLNRNPYADGLLRKKKITVNIIILNDPIEDKK